MKNISIFLKSVKVIQISNKILSVRENSVTDLKEIKVL